MLYALTHLLSPLLGIVPVALLGWRVIWRSSHPEGA